MAGVIPFLDLAHDPLVHFGEPVRQGGVPLAVARLVAAKAHQSIGEHQDHGHQGQINGQIQHYLGPARHFPEFRKLCPAGSSQKAGNER